MSTAQSSIFSSILARPSSDIALVCSCLQTPTTISITNTQTATSTTTITPIFNGQVTITPPIVTLQTTETDTITVIVTTITATTTTTEEITATATQTVVPYACSNPWTCSGDRLLVGCSSSSYCYCVQFEGSSTEGFCSTASVYTISECQVSADCPTDQVCITNTCAGNICVPYEATCANTASQVATRRRFRRVAAHRSVWSEVFGRYMDIYTNP